MSFAVSRYFTLILMMLMPACTPVAPVTGASAIHGGRLLEDLFVTADGIGLKLSRWKANHPKAIVVALHGFNDYRRFFSPAAEYLQQQGIYCYAYDQRGFGESPRTGMWAGSEVYAADVANFSALVKEEHPGVPVYLLGESMGGAVIIAAMTVNPKPSVDGVILSAPAVWGRKTMPWYQTSLLWALSHTLPWVTLTGRGLDIMPSDNIEMLRALGRDPLVIKETRVDAISGLADLMDTALASANKLNVNTLLLYGKKDQIVPAEPTELFIRSLLSAGMQNKTVSYYENGYHMLLRDLQAPVIWHDIAEWIGKTHG
ncbi:MULTISPECIES: alpha/beta hydrolase [Methylomonas]|uniref:alpha/beta hydrolase n=1 Tax=Methylomonas TaxID=416 RepID=UPI0012318AEE|nr:alpha/beta hydrolase [Methylomonas rhizoryzae]